MQKNTRLRIAFITPEFVTEPYFSGGLANYVHRVTKALAELGHDVSVLTLSDVDSKEFDYDGVKVYRIQTGRFRYWLNFLARHKLSGTSRWLDFSYQAYRKLARLNKQEHFDILQFPNSRACAFFSILLLRLPFTIRISCYRPLWNMLGETKRTFDARACEFFESFCYRLSRNIFAPSTALKRILMEKENKDIRVIRTPFYLEINKADNSVYQQFLNGKDYLLFLGRLQMHKGVHILGQALPDIFAKFPDIYAVFVGLDGTSPTGTSMRQYIIQQNDILSERVIFLDAVHHEQLYPIIEGARLVVLPSLVDNFPNTMLESMGLGKPVLGTIGCSFDEVIEEGKDGFLVNPGNPVELARKIIEVWERKDLENIGKNATIKIKDFTPEKLVPQLVDYYEELIVTRGKN